jgi:PAS domain S-box-containing protein
VSKTESHSRNSTTSEQKKHDFFKEEANKLLIEPFTALAWFTTFAGILALVFEVRYFSQLTTKVHLIYISRLSAVSIAFILLVVANTKLGKKHPVFLVHLLLLSIICSFGVMIYLIPNTLVFNSQLISLILFTASLFLSWEVSNQIFVAIYYNLVFGVSIVMNTKSVYLLPNIVESVILVIIISLMAIVASYINYKLRQDAAFKNFEVSLSEKKFRNLFENSAEGIFQFAKDGKFVTANPAFLKMLGFSTEEEIKKINFASDIFKRKSDWELLEKLLEKQGKVRNYRVPITKKDGSEITVRMNVRLSDEDDFANSFLEGSLQDITQQVLAEQDKQKALDALRLEKLKADTVAKKAQQESSFKSKFLASMSHEVRTPMNSVMGFLTLIENDLFESKEELKGFAKDARTSAESLLDIINGILDISKIEAGKMDLDIYEFNLENELKKVNSIITQPAKNKGLAYEVFIDPTIPVKLFGDSTRIRQIVINLLSNAVKFTEVGKVSLSVNVQSRSDEHVDLLFVVQDTGHGIPSEKVNLLFEPYVQVKTKKGSKEGTGLGLVIAKEFVKLMHGQISVESKVGFGTKFTFNIKLRLNMDAKIAETEIEHSQVSNKNEPVQSLIDLTEKPVEQKKKKKLLLVEDNPISQNLELKILREVGYDVDAVSTGQDAIDHVVTENYNLVLMDVEMTDMDGIAATKKIRDLRSSASRIPIIAVTAHSSMKDRERCLAAGMDDYIAKPINIHFLKITIDQWLNSGR